MHDKEKKHEHQTYTHIRKDFCLRNLHHEEKAEANPKTLMARLWRWHTGWCPGWKAYQAHLAEQMKP